MKKNYSNKQVKAMKTIATLLKEMKQENKKLSRLDYFLLGGISFNEVQSTIFWMKKNNDITAVDYYYLNDYVNIQRHIGVYKKKESILAIKFVFGSKEITDLQKEVIWHEIIRAGVAEENIDDIVFSAAVRAYAIKKGYLKVLNNNVSKTKSLKK